MINPSIVIADDHPLLLKGLYDFLTENGYRVIDSAQDGNSAYNKILKLKPDIAILDIEMPKMNGLEVAKECKKNQLETKIVLITLHKEPELIHQAKSLNVSGYILKEYTTEELKTCLEKIKEGASYFSQNILQRTKVISDADDILKDLTPSEKKILRLIVMEKSNKEIADLLFISVRTVEKHRSNIIQKLNISQKTNALLLWAKDHKNIFLS